VRSKYAKGTCCQRQIPLRELRLSPRVVHKTESETRKHRSLTACGQNANQSFHSEKILLGRIRCMAIVLTERLTTCQFWLRFVPMFLCWFFASDAATYVVPQGGWLTHAQRQSPSMRTTVINNNTTVVRSKNKMVVVHDYYDSITPEHRRFSSDILRFVISQARNIIVPSQPERVGDVQRTPGARDAVAHPYRPARRKR
jgi:hypothetical protein